MATGLSNASGLAATSSSLILRALNSGLAWSGNAPTQGETTTWQGAVVANGGTVSAGRFITINNFIAAEKAAGTWALTDDYWPLWGESAPQSLTSLKQLRLATVVAAPTFVIDRGYTFDGVANYINTGFIPGTHAVAMNGDNQRIAVYLRADTNGALYSVGVQNSATQNLAFVGRNGAAMTFTLNHSGNNFAVATAVGYSAGSRANGGLPVSGYRNGVLVSTPNAASVGTVLPTFAIYIGCRNGLGTAQIFRPDSTGFVCVGAPLSAAQELAQYNNVQAWASAIGANV